MGIDNLEKNERNNIFVYAEDYGVVNGNNVDSSDALQSVIDNFKGVRIVLPPAIMIKKTIKYYSQTIISGVAETRCVIWAGAGFVGTNMFEPVTKTRQSVQEPDFSNFTLADQSAVNVSRGTSSQINGIELVGTFVAKIDNIKGVRLNATIHCDAGTDIQHTVRPYLRRINGSNVNWHILFEPTQDDRFAYGDIYVSDLKTSGSSMKGVSIRDTDGLQINGAVIFPNGGIEISGHYLNLTNIHPFEPKALLSETRVPACISIVPRSVGSYSRHVNISNVACGFAGRLADTTSGNPPQSNNGAPSIIMESVMNFNVSFTSNNPSMGALHLIDCHNGVFNVSSTDTNTQVLGSGKLTPGTSDTVRMEKCNLVTGHLTDISFNRRYSIFMDDECSSNHITGVVSRGYTIGTDLRIPENGNVNVVSLIIEGTTTTVRETRKPHPEIYTITGNAVTPYTPNISNNDVIKFQNNAVTNVTDLPDIPKYTSVVVTISDNNATRLVDITNGGKFNLGGMNIMGRGTVLRLYRDDMTGNLIKY